MIDDSIKLFIVKEQTESRHKLGNEIGIKISSIDEKVDNIKGQVSTNEKTIIELKNKEENLNEFRNNFSREVKEEIKSIKVEIESNKKTIWYAVGATSGIASAVPFISEILNK